MAKFNRHRLNKILYSKLETIPKPLTLTPTTTVAEELKIGIIGAGMSGLYSAHLLDKVKNQKIQYTIFESENRVGGRVKTHKFDDDDKFQYADLGAMRIPESHEAVINLIKSFNLELIPYYMRKDNTFVYVNGTKDNQNKIMTTQYANDHPNDLGFLKLTPIQQVPSDETSDSVLSSDPNELIIQLKPEANLLKWTSVPKLYDSVFDYLATQLDNIGAKKFIEVYDKYSIQTYFEKIIVEWLDAECLENKKPKEVYTQRLIRNLLAYGEIMITSTGLNNLALTEEVFHNRNFGAENWKTILGGLERLPEALAERIQSKIKLQHRVNKIERTKEGKLKVHYVNNKIDIKKEGRDGYEEFDRLIITVPFASVRRWDLERLELSFPKREAIRSFNYDHSTKVCIQTKKRFWEINNNIYGGITKTDLPLRTVVYPSYGEKNEGKGSFIVSYTWQNDAILWANVESDITEDYGNDSQNKQQRARYINYIKEIVTNNINKIHEGANLTNDDILKVHVKVWLEAFAKFSPGQYSHLLEGMEPERGVHFAGEHLSLDQAWIQGAMNSSRRAVGEILVQNRIMEIEDAFDMLFGGLTVNEKEFDMKTWKKYFEYLSHKEIDRVMREAKKEAKKEGKKEEIQSNEQ